MLVKEEFNGVGLVDRDVRAGVCDRRCDVADGDVEGVGVPVTFGVGDVKGYGVFTGIALININRKRAKPILKP